MHSFIDQTSEWYQIKVVHTFYGIYFFSIRFCLALYFNHWKKQSLTFLLKQHNASTLLINLNFYLDLKKQYKEITLSLNLKSINIRNSEFITIKTD